MLRLEREDVKGKCGWGKDQDLRKAGMERRDYRPRMDTDLNHQDAKPAKGTAEWFYRRKVLPGGQKGTEAGFNHRWT
jgi:hypothetical protein